MIEETGLELFITKTIQLLTKDKSKTECLMEKVQHMKKEKQHKQSGIKESISVSSNIDIIKILNIYLKKYY